MTRKKNRNDSQHTNTLTTTPLIEVRLIDPVDPSNNSDFHHRLLNHRDVFWNAIVNAPGLLRVWKKRQ